MSYIRFILISGVLLCLFACHRTPHYPETMLRAEQLMDVAPDSALTLLAQLTDSVAGEDESTQMHYHLLTIKAKDKCYIPHTSDSLMKVLVQYYEDRGTPEQQMEAYYYLGSTYRDMQDAPRALNCYQKAIDASAEGKEYKMLSRIYSQMGTLYMYQKLYDEAIPVLKKAYHCCLSAEDSLSLPYALRDIGRAFTAQHDADSTLYYYESGYQAAKRINDVEQVSIVQGELADIYIQLGRYEQARVALLQSTSDVRGDGNIAPQYAGWGDLYKKIGQLDSAEYYYHKALKIGGVYVKRGAYWSLYEIARDCLHDKDALQYLDQYFVYQDSVQEITDTEAVKKVEALYNYHHIENENNRLALSNEKSKTSFYQLIIGIALLSLTFGGIFFYERKKKRLQLEQEQRLRFFEEIRNKESQGQIERNNRQIATLQEQLTIVRAQNDLAKEELLTIRKNLLEEKNNSIVASCLERETLISLFHHSVIYLLIAENCKASNFRMKEAHWIELRKEIDATYNDFTNRLYALYPKLSEVELRVCYLIKVSISASDIAALVCLKNNSVSSIRKRLYQKIHGVPGTTAMMDSFIVDF